MSPPLHNSGALPVTGNTEPLGHTELWASERSQLPPVTLVQPGSSRMGQTPLGVRGFPASVSCSQKRKQRLPHTLPHGCQLPGERLTGLERSAQNLSTLAGISQTPAQRVGEKTDKLQGRPEGRSRERVPAPLGTEPMPPGLSGQCCPQAHPSAGQNHALGPLPLN